MISLPLAGLKLIREDNVLCSGGMTWLFAAPFKKLWKFHIPLVVWQKIEKKSLESKPLLQCLSLDLSLKSASFCLTRVTKGRYWFIVVKGSGSEARLYTFKAQFCPLVVIKIYLFNHLYICSETVSIYSPVWPGTGTYSVDQTYGEPPNSPSPSTGITSVCYHTWFR